MSQHHINHSHRFIFLHIPKCAGNSLKRALRIPRFPGAHLRASTFPISLREKYFKFTFIRNPWDRFVSAYFFLLKGGIQNQQDRNLQKILHRHDSFSDFTKNCDFSKILHFKPLMFFTNGPLDFIGRCENIQEDFECVCNTIGLPPQKLSYQNVSPHEAYTDYYDDETREIIAERYAKDIEYFGYKFGE